MNKIIKLMLDKKYRFTFLCGHGFYNNMSDERFLKKRYNVHMGKKLNLKNPVTFNEKLQWLKINDRNPEYTKMVDKYEVKKYVADKIGEEYIIPTLGVWEKFDDIDFDALPEQFVLKCTHDSGGLVICKDKSKLDMKSAKVRIENSLKRNYYWLNREWPYKNVRPRIIAEQYMEDENVAEGLTDYKFFCFNGKPKLLYVSQGLQNHATAAISFYDLKGEQMPFHREDYRPIEGEIVLPEKFNEMIILAEKLANGVKNPFIRIDLYSVCGKIYFSEITFFPCSGTMPIEPKEWDETLGSWITLPTSHKEN